MNAQPKVSAIVIMYNCAAFVADALISILAQTRPVDEIVVVDDGSTDDSAQQVQPFLRYGVRYVRQENRGPSAARNRGLALSTGDVLAFLDCDDLWLPHKTEVQLRYLADHPQVGLVGGDTWWWATPTNRWTLRQRGRVPPAKMREEILVSNFVGNPSAVLLPRRVVEEVGGFDERLPFGVDWDLWIRIAARYPLGFVRQPVAVYRWHPHNLSHQRQWERLDVLRDLALKHIAHLAPPARRQRLAARVRGRDALARAHHLRATEAPRRAQWRYAWAALRQAPWDAWKEKLRFWALLLLPVRRRPGAPTPQTIPPEVAAALQPPPGWQYSFLRKGG